MQYKGDIFKKMLEAILAQRHNQPIHVGNYFHMPDNGGVSVDYEYRESGKTKGHTTNIGLSLLIQYQMNFSY